MTTIAAINGFADIVLDGEDPTQLVVPETSADVNDTNLPPPTLVLPPQRPHFLTFKEQIDEEMVHREVINRDE